MSLQQQEVMDFGSQRPCLSDSLESHEPLYAQQSAITNDLPVLILTSHAHAPPLKPTPDLKYDLRSLPNPPKNVRDTQVGTSKRLQEWLLADHKFLARRDQIEADIKTAMKEKQLAVGGEADLAEEERNDEEHPQVSSSAGNVRVLRVGISCQMGKHRSVAMIEQLSETSWPGWQVEIFHRDVMLKKGDASKVKGRGKRGRGSRKPQLVFDETEEDDE